MTSGPWWEGARPVEATIACGGAAHRLRWQQGRLSAPHHPDPDGERLLASLGGSPPPCLHLVELWTRHRHDLRALTLGSRGPDDQPAVDLAALDAHPPNFAAPSTRRPPAGLASLVPRYFDLVLEDRWQCWRDVLTLLNLPAPLQVRWGAAAAAHAYRLLAPGGEAKVRPALPADLRADPVITTVKDLEQAAPAITLALLDAAVVGRARRAARRWLGPGPAITVAVLPAAATPTLEWSAGDIRIGLHHDWLWRVWGHDLTLISDAFAVDAVVTSPDVTTLRLARRSGTTVSHDLHLDRKEPSPTL